MTRLKMIAIGAAALLAMGLGWAGPAAAQTSGGVFDIHVFTCPVGYTGMNYLNDCPPTAKVGARIDGAGSSFAASATTDANGETHTPGVPAGAYTISLDVPGDFNAFITFCGAPGEKEPRQLTNPNTNQIGVKLTGTETIVCSFYVIPENAKGDGAALPNTGAGPMASTGDVWLPLALLAGAFGLAGLALRRRAER